MHSLSQSPTDPAFYNDPYPFYDRARAAGPLVRWDDYGLPVTTTFAATNDILRDRRFGREQPANLAVPVPAHLEPFHAVERHSMLELEPPRHTRLRGLVLRAFTSRRIAALEPGIERLCHDLIDRFPPGRTDLLDSYARALPVIVIARLLGVPETMADQLLAWSNAMVAMYQARRTRALEDEAAAAAAAFAAFLRGYLDERRTRPADDLITHLLAAEAAGDSLSSDELVSTCILLMNAGHEATVHTLGNGVATLLASGCGPAVLAPARIAATVEEILRFDPPLHLFTRYACEDVALFGHRFRRGDRVGCLLAAANRDPAVWADPHRFDPARPVRPNLAFGAGLHFCVGAPLARLELRVALATLWARCPRLSLTHPPTYRDAYHFHGLTRLDINW